MQNERPDFIGKLWYFNRVIRKKTAVDIGKSGKIVITSSIAAYQPSPVLPAYSTSKIAVANFAQSLALELGNYNVNVNVVNPGFVYTPIYSEGGAMLLRDAVPALQKFETGEQVIGALAYAQAVGRLGRDRKS